MFKKFFLEIGPLITLLLTPSFIISRALSNDFFIYEFDLLEIFSNAFFGLYLILIRLIVFYSLFFLLYIDKLL